ncbi:hypothetical protein [Novipirellula artificiosorum]|uniref:hypothetical protein n=1 Tax=Novipirellula artificiosorum TaxID=2528016 RepID=UPI0011B52E03|nr:hypothetical protein [Novipirellula artificiosorum]
MTIAKTGSTLLLLTLAILLGFVGTHAEAESPILRLTFHDGTEVQGQIEADSTSAPIRFRDSESQGSDSYDLDKLRRIESIDYLNRLVRNRIEKETPSQGLSLVGGDFLAGSIEQMDDEGVTFRSPQTAATFVENASIQSVFFQMALPAAALSRDEQQRLLHGVGLSNEDPSSVLCFSISGDVLRGEFVSLDSEKLRIRVLSAEKQIARQTIARIERIPVPNAPLVVTRDSQKQSRQVNVIFSGGCSLTLHSVRITDREVMGVHDLFDECKIPIESLDCIEFKARDAP